MSNRLYSIISYLEQGDRKRKSSNEIIPIIVQLLKKNSNFANEMWLKGVGCMKSDS